MKVDRLLILFLLMITTIISLQYLIADSFSQNSLLKQNSNETSDENRTLYGWYNVSGKWNLTPESLHGGTSDNTTSSIDNILMSPVAARDPSNISTTFQINNLDENESNSVSIVYSAIDPSNYRQAGIYVYKNDIFARFADISNGSLVSPTPWPGVNTGIKYVPGSVLNMTLKIQNESQTLMLNDTEYPYNGTNTKADGFVGLKYDNIKDIDFYNYRVQSPDNTGQNFVSQDLFNYINENLSDDQIGHTYEISDSVSVLLEDKSLPDNSFIHLYDSTPYQITSGHIAAKLPCDEDNDTPISILMGQAPNLQPAELEFIEPLSASGELCLYHVNIASNESNPITDIAVHNNSTDEIDFPGTSSVTVSVNEISDIAEDR